MTDARSSEWSRRLVASLVESGALSTEAGDSALEEAAGRGVPVGMVLTARGLVDSGTALSELSSLSGLQSVDIYTERPTREAFRLVPEMLAREIGAVGYRLQGNHLTLACMEPIPVLELRDLAGFLGPEVVDCVLADPTAIERTMVVVYPQLANENRGGSQPKMQTAAFDPASVSGNGSKAGSDTMAVNGATAAVEMGVPRAAAGQPGSSATGSESSSPELDDDSFLVLSAAAETAAAAGGSPPTPAAPTSSPLAAQLDDVLAQALDAGDGSGSGDELLRFSMDVMDSSGDSGGIDIDALLAYAVENGASDLHLTTELPPMIRIDGSLRPVEGLPKLVNENIRALIYRILTQMNRERFEATKELDASHMVHGAGRFRVNVFQQRGYIGAVLRAIPQDIPAFESLGLPDIVASFADLRRGLVLVTGPTGSGKSTTLASLVNIINESKPLHIVTVEDPIEFMHHHGRAIVNQREVGSDTESFAEALRHVLRQDPDVILIGEMRDMETIQTALTAAETGHLVFATLHTQDAPQTIDRIIDVFPTEQQHQVRIQLASTLEAVVTQQLILSATGLGRVAVAEVMVCTPAIRNLIRSSKTHQIYSLMQTGGAQGMQTMDQGLARAVRAGLITEAIAFDRCHDPSELRDHLKS